MSPAPGPRRAGRGWTHAALAAWVVFAFGAIALAAGVVAAALESWALAVLVVADPASLRRSLVALAAALTVLGWTAIVRRVWTAAS